MFKCSSNSCSCECLKVLRANARFAKKRIISTSNVRSFYNLLLYLLNEVIGVFPCDLLNLLLLCPDIFHLLYSDGASFISKTIPYVGEDICDLFIF